MHTLASSCSLRRCQTRDSLAFEVLPASAPIGGATNIRYQMQCIGQRKGRSSTSAVFSVVSLVCVFSVVLVFVFSVVLVSDSCSHQSIPNYSFLLRHPVGTT